MRTETVSRSLYQFDELSEAAKERAREWFREVSEYPWANENRESMEAFCQAFPVIAKDWQYDTCSYYMVSRFNGEDKIAELSGNRLRTYIVNNYSHILSARKAYQKAGGGNIRKSRIVFTPTDCPFTGYCFDEVLLDNIRDFIAKPDSRTFAELLDDCLEAWAKACRDECNYQNSDDAIDETIRANEYEFLESGVLA